MSIQNLVDCAYLTILPDGCHNQITAVGYIWAVKYGIHSEEEYPFEKTNNTCRQKEEDETVKIAQYIRVDESIEAFVEALDKQPISAMIWYASDLKDYAGGVFDGKKCADETTWVPNFPLLVVGYGVENDTSYWLIKNAWGDQWGERGYFKLSVGAPYEGCGIYKSAQYPSFQPKLLI